MNEVGKLQVLVVDDNPQMRQLLRGLLRVSGISRVAEAEGAMEALEIIRRQPLDLALVDWKMRPVDGLAFTRLLRSPESPNRFLPILMLTAHTEAKRVAAARDAGVNGFIKKPISARSLLDRIGAAMLDTRPFVRTEHYFGPDRRHSDKKSYAGPWRRSTDAAADRVDLVDIEDQRWRA